jgi:DNA helicase-2/ATP-dependent DNA helicase PcrA
MTKVTLSPEQKAIVEYNDGEDAVFVEASAGSGKTRILTERVRYLLIEKKDKFFSVLCLTFTNKAAEEMTERLRGIPKLNERSFIGNFHKFCLNIIKSRYTELGLAKPPHIFNENDTKKILEEVLLKNAILKELYAFPEIIDLAEKAKKQREKLFQCIDFISTQKRDLIEDIPEFESNYKNWGETNTLIYQDYNRRLREQNAIDYDDILLFAHRILLRPAIANIYRRTYQYILIDEAQDLNFAQYNIIKAICGETHKNVLMVGDPKQAIYGFNGASPKFMQEYFVNDFKATKKEINHNYRSSDSVLEIAEKILPNGGKGVNYFKGIAKIKPFVDEKTEAEWVISQINYWIEKGTYSEENKEIVEPITYKNIAVLARNKYVFSSLIGLLDKDEVLKNKYYLKKGLEKFEPESVLIRLFDLGLRILVNPSDILHFNQIIDLLNIKISQTNNRLTDLLTIESINSEHVSNQELALVCKYWNHLIQNPKSLGWVIENLKKDIHLFEHITDAQINEIEKMIFDLAELEKFWDSFARKESSNNQTISNFRYFLALNGSKENREELTLATVHTTKGLEFEIVFLMGMNEGVFPDYRAKTESAKKEERNNAYVAVTRAKRVLYLTFPLKKNTTWGERKQEKSIFLS